jgi:cell division protein ZapB
VRHAELQRTNALLTSQVDALTQERDSLKSRLGAARARVDLPCSTGCPRRRP